MRCPSDGTEMDQLTRHGVLIDHCPACGGVWLDRGELDHLMEAVRPAVELDNPEPAAAPASRAHRAPRGSRAPKRLDPRDDDFDPRDDDRQAERYHRGTKRRRKRRITDILEEIFDFD